MNQKITVEMSVEHARAMARACELMARLGLGQIEYLAEAVRSEEIKFSSDLPWANNPVSPQRLLREDSIESLCNLIKARLGFHPGASRGVGSDFNSPVTGLCWELRNAVLKGVECSNKVDSGLFPSANLPLDLASDQVKYSGKPLPVVRLSQVAANPFVKEN